LNAFASGNSRCYPPSSVRELLSTIKCRLCRLARPARGDIRDWAPMSPMKLLLRFIERFKRLWRAPSGDKRGYPPVFEISLLPKSREMLDRWIKFESGANRVETSLSFSDLSLRSSDKSRRLKWFPREDELVKNRKNSEEIFESLTLRLVFYLRLFSSKG